MFGAVHTTPRTTAVYTTKSSRTQAPRCLDPGIYHAEANSEEIGHDCDFVGGGDEAGQLGKHYEGSLLMQEAARIVGEQVKQACPWICNPTTSSTELEVDQGDNNEVQWRPSFALANKYVGGNECVGWHSDYLMTLGPRPVIAGLSLGARRDFCLRKQVGKNNQDLNDDDSAKKGTSITVAIPMPHNSLVIMYGDAQESWSHAVPRCANSTVGRHGVSGSFRFKFT